VLTSYVASLSLATKVALARRAKSKGINIGGIFKYIKKYEEFSKTNWGAFLNGFLMGVISDAIAGKAEVKCEESKFWGVMECLVGGADTSLDAYYASFGNGYKDLPDTASTMISDIDKNSAELEKDPQVKQVTEVQPNTQASPAAAAPAASNDGGWMSTLKSGWDWVKTKANAALEAVQKKLFEYYDKVKGFFESPLVKGIVQVGGCVAKKDWVQDAALKATVTLLGSVIGVGIAGKIYEILKKAPLIFKELKKLFNVLKETITRTYESPQEKYYTYGKAVSAFFVTVTKIFNAARRLKRFKKLFR